MRRSSTDATNGLDTNSLGPDDERYERRPLRCHEQLDRFMHQPAMEMVVILLIIIDALLVVATLLIELRASMEFSTTSVANTTTLSGETSSDHSATSTSQLMDSHYTESVLKALHITSLVILTFFMIEVFLKVFAQREKFFHHKVQVADAFVIVVSFAVDVAVLVIQAVNKSNNVLNGLGLLILLRLWRLVRIVNSAVLTTEETLHKKIYRERQQRLVAESHANELQRTVAKLQDECNNLQVRLSKYEQPRLSSHIPTSSEVTYSMSKLPPYLPDSTRLPTNVLGDLTDGEYDTAVFNKGPSQQRSGHAYISMDLDPDNITVRSTTDSDSLSLPPVGLRTGNTFTVKKSGIPMTAL